MKPVLVSKKNPFLAVFAPGNLKDFSENWRGVIVAGEMAPLQTVKKPMGELERAAARSNYHRAQRRVRWARGDFSEENLIFRRENRFIADFATGIRRIQAKSGRGGRGGGACSLGHKRVKNYFDTQQRHRRLFQRR